MTEPRTIRFGLLGAGLVAPFHANAIGAAARCELVAVADINEQRTKAIAEQFGCKAYGKLDDLLADDSIDVINILLPNHLHCEPTLAAAKAGKHVLVEKPPSMSIAETNRMIEACQVAGVKLGVVLNCRVRKAVQAIKEAIDNGRFGKLLQGDAYMKWFRAKDYYTPGDWHSSRRSGAGVAVMQAFHYTDLLQYLMGKPASIQARMTNLNHPGAELEDTLRAFIDYDNGARGVVVASTALWPGTDIRIEINGENGTAIMIGERMDTWKFRDDRPEDEAIRDIGRNAVTTGAGGAADFDFVDHQVVIEGMAKAVLCEDCDPIITAPSALVTLEMTLAMYQSAKTGQAVELPITDEESIWK